MRYVCLIGLILGAVLCGETVARAADHWGLVTFGGLPVPGATVTATQGGTVLVTVTNDEGVFTFTELTDGPWSIRVEMTGFLTVEREVVTDDARVPDVEVQLRPFAEIGADAAAPLETARPGTGSETNSPTTEPPGSDDGLLVNGSVLNGAFSRFAQSRAFGNNRRNQGSLYNGTAAFVIGTSAWDAQPYSFDGQPTVHPDYLDMQFFGTFGGPIKWPGVRTRSNLFVGYQRIHDTNSTTQFAFVPTSLEKQGDFTESLPALGRLPIEGLSSEALALLGYYPDPNVIGADGYNYQTPIVSAARTDNVQVRLTHALTTRDQLTVNGAYQRTSIDSNNLFGFETQTVNSGLDLAGSWSRRISDFVLLRARYQFTTTGADVTPYFANRTNVSGDAGITGNNQDPVNWGPPTLLFSSGLAGLTDSQYARNDSRTHVWGAEASWYRGRHNVTFGGEGRHYAFDVWSQQDPRGTFTFDGALTGSDIADFLLGVPATSSIAFGNADKFLRNRSYAAWLTDDWRVSPALTINAGVRWEYDTPMTETGNRLSTLDIAPAFADTQAVTAEDPTGPLTGRQYPRALMHGDRSGVQPRVGLAWRPLDASSLVVRGGYSVFRNTGVYQPIALLLAQQPPFSKTSSAANSTDNPLTLANGFPAATGTANTFAVDPDLRVGLAHNWQVSAQRDLPASMTMIATYLGTYGSRLLQEIAPQTYPDGSTSPCPTCPSGYVFLTSNGHSTRHAGQLQIRRRLSGGFTATTQYTLATAHDNAGAFTGVSLSGSAIAQDWLNPDAEWAPSNFDQRHQLTAQVEYTTRGWTVTSQMTTGSGLPVTPVYFTSFEGTGVSGTIRPDALSTPEPPDGLYLDPSAYAAPRSGQWGTAGRNSARGPLQFQLNAGVMRTFTLGSRTFLDWRIDATNVLNRVTFSTVNALVGSPQFGLPNQANAMRKIQSTLRMRF